ncbi:MAG: phosphate ABC transporter permease subunit PstC [Candidatus Lambdaproteobacteria bacterium]|nr:phosphate ABC transporter permease subunit PstC [Candidatus Lambdaproteobacteria bacterium]
MNGSVAGQAAGATGEFAGRQRRQRLLDLGFKSLTQASATLVLACMAGILLSLLVRSWPSLQRFGAGFLWSSQWDPVTEEFGAAAAIFGSIVSTVIAMALAVPLGLAIALFLVELAPRPVSRLVSYAIELLAAIPSIIYGMWGLFVFAPFMGSHIEPALQSWLGFLPLFRGPPIGIGMLSAGVILALMILPFVSAVMRDVFGMVPAVLKEAAYGMGSTTWEVTRKVTVPFAVQGLVGAGFLGLARAIGETMAVTFVIGNSQSISASLFAPANTIPSTLANEFTEATTPLYLSALVELGLVLFLITFLIQLAAQFWLGRLARGRR